MSTLPSDGSEWVQASIEVPDIGNPVAHTEILRAVENISGVQSVETIGQALHIVYDPLYITEHELERLVKGSGHATGASHTVRDSPFA